LTETFVVVSVMSRAGAEAGVVKLELTYRPAFVIGLEVLEGSAPVIEVIAAGFVPSAAVEAARHSGSI